MGLSKNEKFVEVSNRAKQMASLLDEPILPYHKNRYL
jgi:hypothetical protein